MEVGDLVGSSREVLIKSYSTNPPSKGSLMEMGLN